MPRKPSWEPDHALLLQILAVLAVHYPRPLPDPETALFALTDGDREALLMHVTYLHALGFMHANLVELFPGERRDTFSAARLSWGAGPVLTKKGLNAHLGLEPVVW